MSPDKDHIYCIQCMQFLGLTGPSYFEDACESGEVAKVTCSGCGPTLVNKKGICSGACEDSHGNLDVEIPNGNYIVFPNGNYVRSNLKEIEENSENAFKS